jgi:hypothetical protein
MFGYRCGFAAAPTMSPTKMNHALTGPDVDVELLEGDNAMVLEVFLDLHLDIMGA